MWRSSFLLPVCAVLSFVSLSAVTLASEGTDARNAKTVIATVNGRPITEADLTAMMVTRNVPTNLRDTVRKAFITRLIDYRLMRQFLESRKVKPTEEQLNTAVRNVYRQIRARGGDPRKLLKEHGLDDAALRAQLWLPVAWSLYARQLITDRQIRAKFKEQPHEFDGTQVRASQIVLRFSQTATENEKKEAVARLKSIRQEIADGKTSFADAAKKHSQSPSSKNGGDVGFFPYRGKMAAPIARVAFVLKKGEISEPFTTAFGAHLVTVTDVKPGQLSLEDARPEIFRELAQAQWDARVVRLRKSAKIERR